MSTADEKSLLKAASGGDLGAVQKLLQNGVDVDCKDADSWTPLHWAVSIAHLEVIDTLLSYKADVNAVHKWGDTPLHSAAFWGYLEVVKRLVEAGANIDLKNNRGETALSRAKKENSWDEKERLEKRRGVIHYLENTSIPVNVGSASEKEGSSISFSQQETVGAKLKSMELRKESLVNLFEHQSEGSSISFSQQETVKAKIKSMELSKESLVNMFEYDSEEESNDDSVLDIENLSKLLEENDNRTKDLTSDSDVVLVIGSTGAGKSTFLNLVMGRQFKEERDNFNNRRFTLVEGEGDNSRFKIGHTKTSETSNVSSFFSENSSTYYIDTPGFNDNRATEIDIATSVTIKKICAKANRIRFVLLINAYAFEDARGRGLRANLNHVQEFIGSNFETYRRAFTFLFTHCTDYFQNIYRINLNALSTEEKMDVLDRAKDQLREKIMEVGRTESKDKKLKNLLSYLYTCLTKKEHNCEIIDPVISDIPTLKSKLEPAYPSEKHFLKGSDNVVRINLDSESERKVEQELKRRKTSLISLLKDNLHDELSEKVKKSVSKECLLICKVACFMDFEKCTDTAIDVLRFLKDTYDDAYKKITNKNDPTEQAAITTKINTGHVQYLDIVLKKCISYLKKNMQTPIKLDEYTTNSEQNALTEERLE